MFGRQSLRKTRAELHRSLSVDEREFVMDWLVAAENIFTQITLLSPMTTLLGLTFAESMTEQPGFEAADATSMFVVMIAGYGSRAALGAFETPPALAREMLPFEAAKDPAWDMSQVSQDKASILRSLAKPVGSLAFSDFASVMALPAELWAGYVSLATMQLQRNLRRHTRDWRSYDLERVDGLMRYGYVLRCIDEAYGGEPELLEGAKAITTIAASRRAAR
jgi:hypothetical protein